MDQRLDERADERGTRAPNNLPTFLTSFVGRDAETAQVVRLIESGRLATVTGVPGSGKTRLTIEAARLMGQRFADGVWHVNLAASSDPGPTIQLIASVLGVRSPNPGLSAMSGDADGRSTEDALVEYMADREVLVILDDVEHVVAIVAQLVPRLLADAPRVRIVVTSRLPLGIPGELVWHVPLLGVPGHEASAVTIASSEAVRLFIDRAGAAQPDVDVDDEGMRGVAQIVRRLDGNPLSIELAAARVNVLSIGELAERLERSFDVLTTTDSELEHHTTLRAAIDWGYELLAADERLLFDRLSVFRAPFGLAAAETVAVGDGLPRHRILDAMASLVDKSMITADTGIDGRIYTFGETLREYAVDRLAERAETAAMLRRHAEYHCALATEFAPELRAGLYGDTLDRIARSLPDFSAAIRWALDVGDAEIALDLVGSLYLFWFARRHRDAVGVAERALRLTGAAPAATRARATVATGMLALGSGRPDLAAQTLSDGLELALSIGATEIAAEAHLYQGIAAARGDDPAKSATELETARDLFAEAGESWGIAWATLLLGFGDQEGDELESARERGEAALARFRAADSSYGVGNALSLLGVVARRSGDPSRAVGLHEEALRELEVTGDVEAQAAVVASLGIDERDLGNPERAAEHLDQAIDTIRSRGNDSWLAELLFLAGDTHLAAGDMTSSAERLRESLTVARGVDSSQAKGATVLSLESMAWWSWRSALPERAVRLFAATDAHNDVARTAFFAVGPPDATDALTRARAQLGSELYQSLWAAGRSMSLTDATAYALQTPDEEAVSGRIGLSVEELELGERVAAELGGIGQRREVRLGGVRVAGRRRRPTGERAPLPHQLRASGRLWLAISVVLILTWFSLFAWPATRDWWTERDLVVSGWFVDLRTGVADSLFLAIHAIGSAWFFRPLRWAMLITLVVFKRWRHLLAAVVVFVLVEFIVDSVAVAIGRPRPLVTILGDWQGFAHPSAPVASVATSLVVLGYALIPRGRFRNWWMLLAGAAVTLLVISRIYLGVDHVSDGVVAALFGVAATVVVFRWFVPESAFPVVYEQGTTAHLDVSGIRGEAIRAAVADQLGLDILELEPFGLEGSGGSTPLRLKVAGDPDTFLFAKLYATNHLRADRWYKLGRTILYGSLEDEVGFTSVRRLVEYEDYIALRMKDAGVPSAEPYGFVEITPEREYLIVTEFLRDAEEITTAPVDDAVIDDGLLMIRRLWDAGLAHRDIKPANVMVRDGRLRLIDVAFGTIRPSPWRQAVDLANMMIILALRTDAERVYDRALRYFAPEDIAEAFAATRSVTIPTQTRSLLRAKRRADGVDVVQQFKQISPHREPIAIQRWGRRRIALTAAAALGAVVLLALFARNLTSGGFV